MQQGKRLTKYITFVSYFSKGELPPHHAIKMVQGKSYLLFLQGFDPHNFQLVYDLLLQTSSYLHESEAMQFSTLHFSLTFCLPTLLGHNLQFC